MVEILSTHGSRAKNSAKLLKIRRCFDVSFIERSNSDHSFGLLSNCMVEGDVAAPLSKLVMFTLIRSQHLSFPWTCCAC